MEEEKFKELENKIKCIRYTSTWRCNFKCVSCHIWEIPPDKESELTPEQIDALTKNELLKDVSEVIISGGEPTLRDDFVEMVLAFHKNLKKAKFGITINGFDPQRAYNFFKEIKERAPDLIWNCIGVSLNGPKEIHDMSRGVPGSFENAIETAKLLKSLNLNVAFSFTFIKENVDHYQWTVDFARSIGLGVYICWTVMNDRFRTTEEDLVFQNNPNLIHILQNRVGKFDLSGDLKADFFKYRENIKTAYLWDSIINKRIMPCHACKTFFHLAPNGDVFPCNFKLSDDRIIGNVKDEPFDKIWARIPQTLFDEIKAGECMFPNGVCGDSDINRSIRQVDKPIFDWFVKKVESGKNLIEKE